MSEKTYSVRVMDWGVEVILNPGVMTDDSNILEKVQSIMEECQKAGKNKLLVDASSAERNVSITSMHGAGELLQKLKHWGITTAIIGKHLVNSKNSNFMTTTARNRGFHIEYFKDKKTALSWLLNDKVK